MWLIPRLGEFIRENPDIQVVTRSDARPFDLMQARIDISLFYGNGLFAGRSCIACLRPRWRWSAARPYLPAGTLSSLQQIGAAHVIQCSSRPEDSARLVAHQGWEPIGLLPRGRVLDFQHVFNRSPAGDWHSAIAANVCGACPARWTLNKPWHFVQASDSAYYVACASHCAGLCPDTRLRGLGVHQSRVPGQYPPVPCCAREGSAMRKVIRLSKIFLCSPCIIFPKESVLSRHCELRLQEVRMGLKRLLVDCGL